MTAASAQIVSEIPQEWRRQARWFVWRTEQPAGRMFEERRLHPAFKEYPGQTRIGYAAPRLHARGSLRGTPDLSGASDLAMALYYLDFRAGAFEGVAYIREDGTAEYFPIEPEAAP